MSALEFANEFINDLPDLLKDFDSEHTLCFNQNTYEDDPNLTILKSELNKIGYDLKLIKKENIPAHQDWKLIKL